MPATCKCTNGHVFTSAVVEDSPEINYFNVEDEVCPECGAEFDIEEVYDDSDDVW